jgi:Ca2+-binding RTX toxin-like protein
LLVLVVAGPVSADPLTGGFSPTIIGERADLNGDGVVNGRDDSNAFYGETSIIDGQLDCNAWGAIANDGSEGSGAISTADDCSLVGFDGTPDGVTIEVVDGEFQVANGPLPTVFNADEPGNDDVGDSDFAWSARDGRVDSDGNEAITGDDCHFGLVGVTVDVGLGDATDGADILGNPGANECGFVSAPNTADNGLVDLNSDADITAAGDSCSNGCFFGLDVDTGKVQGPECEGFEGDPRHDVIGTPGPDDLSGTSGRDIICGRGGNDVLRGLGGNDLLLGAGGADLGLGGGGSDEARGGGGGDELRGGDGGDTLLGQKGPDSLFGQKGPDFLNGGDGNDSCNGGQGADTLRSC